MKVVTLPAGERVRAFGVGTWYMGENRATRAEEIATIRLALELGVTLIDTAEMYGEGLAEQLVAEAIDGRRDEVFLVSKVYPHNASRKGALAACERSLKRLKTDRIDLYLLHWRGTVPLAETMEAFTALQRSGKIRYYGVSNLDLVDTKELWAVPGGAGVQTDQLLYNLTRRGIEWDLVPWLRERDIPVMAYSPIEQARLLRDPKLIDFAQRYGMTPAQAALAWLLANGDIIVIPKTSRRERLKENLGALDHRLTAAQLAELDRLFPPPTGPRPLEMLLTRGISRRFDQN
jgi:diketogulonate reductase-like aldo/keto reductase